MSEETYATSPTPHITIETCGGDLTVEGTSASEVIFHFADEGNQVQREGETFRVTIGGDARVTCPVKSSLTLRQIGGDFSAGDLGGTLAVDSIGGDASLRGAGVVTLQSTRGDLSARDIAGDLRLGSIGGDLEARRITGLLAADSIGGDFSARSLDGGAEVKSVGGDASIETDIAAGKTYRLTAGGDLTMRLPSDAGARVRLAAGGEIEQRLAFKEWTGDEHAGQGLLGDGGATIELSAGGDLTLLPSRGEVEFDFNFDSIGIQIEAKMEQFEREMDVKMHELGEQIARMTAVGARDIEDRLRRIDVEGLSRRAERTAERARRRAQEAAARARAQAERAAERARRRAERHVKHGRHGFHFNVDLPFGRGSRSTPAPAASTTTDAERRLILKMLEEKKITAEEAGRLLQALEG